MNFETKEKYNIDDLVEIVKILRSPNGCPWDKVQTHESVRQDFIEEVYEAAEAIDTKDTGHLREELGDVLFQVVFHCELESEKNSFNLDDVADEICKKMILRHPHVFSSVTADTTDEVLKNWDAIKMNSKSQKTPSEAMDSVSKTLPSLMRAEKLQSKAKRAGIDFKNTDCAFQSVSESLESLKAAIDSNDTDAYQKKIGELLFSTVRLSRFMGVDCEKSLYNVCNDFTNDFKSFEKFVAQKGIDIQNSDVDTLNELWNEFAKKRKNLEENLK
ncbi:MAG: nucleoside triphosphate pyrophosphohydrolase [Acutalibacteraceae bacterium]